VRARQVIGVYKGKHAYLRDNWNMIDFFVVFTMLLALRMPDLLVCKVFRALRPLRIISHDGHLKVRFSQRLSFTHASSQERRTECIQRSTAPPAVETSVS